MDKIREYFEQFVKLNDNDWMFFKSKLIKNEYQSKTTILKIGQIENNLSFIEKGSVRFFIPKQENDCTFNFSFENQFVSAYDSFITQKPSIYQIETLSNTTLWILNYDDLQDIYNNTEIGNTIGRKIAENIFLAKSKRELSLLTDSPEQRYINLFTEQPRLIKEIPLKHLSSYIGVTPQALSRIRKRIS
ncbi:MAG: Crp/Fnr family transcriptional regulator [Flavobacteriaceae bacterium]|nr:Crp/Fnr family transcriptional regulator [Flavobacteriaceae bacterium]